MNWIACRVAATGMGSLLSDFAMCLAHVSCQELGLLQDSLRLLQPVVDSIDGRVGKRAGMLHGNLHELVASLWKQTLGR